jgi:polyferredoxin
MGLFFQRLQIFEIRKWVFFLLFLLLLVLSFILNFEIRDMTIDLVDLRMLRFELVLFQCFIIPTLLRYQFVVP